MSVLSLAKLFPSETEGILFFISEILALEPSARGGSVESLTSMLHRIMTILEFGDIIFNQFKITDHPLETHAVLLKEVHSYRFFLGTLRGCMCRMTEVRTVLFNKLDNVKFVLGHFRQEIVKDN